MLNVVTLSCSQERRQWASREYKPHARSVFFIRLLLTMITYFYTALYISLKFFQSLFPNLPPNSSTLSASLEHSGVLGYTGPATVPYSGRFSFPVNNF